MDWEWRVGWAVRRAELSCLPCYKLLAKWSKAPILASLPWGRVGGIAKPFPLFN